MTSPRVLLMLTLAAVLVACGGSEKAEASLIPPGSTAALSFYEEAAIGGLGAPRGDRLAEIQQAAGWQP